MRAVRTDDIQMKLLIERKLSSDNLEGGELLKVSAVDENTLILKNKVSQRQVENISEIKLFFFVGGKWKTYNLCAFTPVYYDDEMNEGKSVSGIKFRVIDNLEKDFLKDLSMCQF